MFDDLNDAQLMQLVHSGEHPAFAEIVKRHTDRFFSLAYRTLQNRSDAEDVVQQAFIKLWQNPSAWDGEKSQFTTWFYRVIINACHDAMRKNKYVHSANDDTLEAVSTPVSSEQQLLEDNQKQNLQKHYLQQAIRALPASQRDALNLVVYVGLPQKQAAQVMDISVKAVESLLVRAKRTLAKNVNRYANNRHTELMG